MYIQTHQSKKLQLKSVFASFLGILAEFIEVDLDGRRSEIGVSRRRLLADSTNVKVRVCTFVCTCIHACEYMCVRMYTYVSEIGVSM